MVRFGVLRSWIAEILRKRRWRQPYPRELLLRSFIARGHSAARTANSRESKAVRERPFAPGVLLSRFLGLHHEIRLRVDFFSSWSERSAFACRHVRCTEFTACSDVDVDDGKDGGGGVGRDLVNLHPEGERDIVSQLCGLNT